MEIDLYLKLMEEIKARMKAVKDIMTKKTTTSFDQTNIEFACLQIRKILELITMGSLVANQELLESINADYANYWNAKRTLYKIEKLNSHFYPEPIIEKPSSREGVKNDLVGVKGDYLTREKLEIIYDSCCNIIHANNPFAEKINYGHYAPKISEWYRLIMALLSIHLVKFKEGEMYLIHMEEKDGRVHGYLFSQCEE